MAENKEVLENLAQSGEVASAEEYLETVLSGSDLPSQRAGVDHFTQFFPVVPQLATEHPKLLHELRATMAGRIPRRRSPVSRGRTRPDGPVQRARRCAGCGPTPVARS